MSMLSKEIAKWLQMNPGRIVGESEDTVWLQAKLKFIEDRRWRGEFDIALFMQHMIALGYRPETHTNHGDQTQFVALALPEKYKGF